MDKVVGLNAGMLAADGRCKTLDASADGYVRAEAVGTILMRVISSLDKQALAEDQTLPHALILGAAVNQDGKSSSLTAPNGPAQQALIRTALNSAQLAASKVRDRKSPSETFGRQGMCCNAAVEIYSVSAPLVDHKFGLPS